MKATKAKAKRGAPLLFAAPMRSVLVTLDPASIERAKKLGAGNVSAGIREALTSKSPAERQKPDPA